MELEDLSIVERAMLSGGSEWDSRHDRVDIPGFVMSDGPHGVRRLRRRRPPRHRRIQAGHLLPDRLHRGQHLIRRSPKRWARRSGKEAHDLDVERVAWDWHEHQAQTCCGRNFEYYSDLIVAGRRRRLHSRHPEQRRLRMPEAFRGQQLRIAPPASNLLWMSAPCANCT